LGRRAERCIDTSTEQSKKYRDSENIEALLIDHFFSEYRGLLLHTLSVTV
jgi:hypothetical protein